ncbi:MAG: hypothetical protein FJ144_19730 [Deltaproteobacteria bacterium]|nr:hypothetical protein [Deltaproteobacteria bacterium]
MPCLLALAAFFFPRVVLFFLWLLTPAVLAPAYEGNGLWLILGFFFLPLTTIAYAFAYDPVSGGIAGLGLVGVVIAVLIDLGLLGGGARARR